MKKLLLLVIVCMTCIAFLAGWAWGVVEHCVSDETGFLEALSLAASNGDDDIIKVVQGTYVGNFSYNSYEGHSISVLGGYTSGCAGRVVDPANTVLEADGLYIVLTLYNFNGADVLVEGLTIRNGNDGVSAQSTSSIGSSGDISLMHNIITGNTGGGSASYAYSYSDAGTSGNITLEENTISENSSYASGVFAYSYSVSDTSGSVTITGNTITGNTTENSDGGGVHAHSRSGLGDSGDVTLSNNIIMGNYAAGHGGGVFISSEAFGDMATGGDITLTNNVIWGNTAAADSAYGGGVYVTTSAGSGSGTSGTITLTDNTIIGNTVQGENNSSGGGVYARSSSSYTGMSGAILISNNTIEGNAARGNAIGTGGGVYANVSSTSGTAGAVTLTNNTIRENYSTGAAGGVFAVSSGSVTLEDNNINGNKAVIQYGGVDASSGSGDVTLTSNTIAGNSAQGTGGAYVDAGEGDIIVINNTITGNSASSLYGGLYLAANLGTRTLINNTVTRNSAYHIGGVVIVRDDNTLNCYNNSIWGNTASVVADDIGFLMPGTGTMNGYNNNYADMDGSWDNGGETNINVDPQFVDPDNGDFRLRSSSLCKDAGTNTVPNPPGLPSTDFEGDARIINGTVDIGADEVSIVTTCVSTATGLQNALTTAQSNSKGDVIMVQQGTYTRTGNFTYTSIQGYGVTLLGGYESGCAGRVIDPTNTVLDAEGSGRVLYLYNNTNGGNITVGGFTIQNGDATQWGGGVYALSDADSGPADSITFTDNIITGNTAGGSGGGVYAVSNADTGQSGAVTLMDNIVTGNTCNNNQGGGVYANSNGTTGAGDVILTGNVITGNTARYYGGGVRATSISASGTAGAVTIINNIIAKNSVSYSGSSGGGVHAFSFSGPGPAGTVTFTNNTMTGNTADNGGGVSLQKEDNIINCYNNIMWGNAASSKGDDIYLSGTGTAYGYNNDYHDMNISWNGGSDGNIDVDPLFEDVTDPDPLNWDLHLRVNSPCIDAGTASAPGLPIDDFEGDHRIINATVDMGADEALIIPVFSKSSALCPSGLGFGAVETGSTRNLNLIMNNTTDSDINVDPITVGPSDPYFLTNNGCDGVTLHPGDTCSITIQFAPSLTGTFYGSFQIPTDDPEAGTITVALSGIGTSGTLSESRGTSVSGPGAASGVVPVPDVNAAGTGDVTPASSPVVQDSSSSESTASVETSEASSSLIVISSLPPSIQRNSEKQLLLEETQKPFDRMVFGEVQVGASDQLKIILSHEQGAAIQMGDIILPSAPYVIVEDKCSGTLLDSEGECAVTVQFAPPEVNTFYDYFLIPTDDPGVGTLRINLEGVGVAE
jgi:hypothetical protein